MRGIKTFWYLGAAALFLILFVLMGDAQERTNTHYAREYQGTTVAARVTAAQAECNVNTAIPCYIVIDADMVTMTTGAMPAKCVQCYWIDYRNGGTVGGNHVVTSSIQAAIDAASVGGVVEIPEGTFDCGITINKPIILQGKGQGGFADNTTLTTYAAPTTLVNSSASQPCIKIQLPASNALGGVALRDFSILGNKAIGGATAGACISIQSGTDTGKNLRSVLVEGVTCHDPKGPGLEILDNAYMLTVREMAIYRGASHGLSIGRSSGTGVPSQIWLYNVISDMNTGNGLEVGVATADVYLFGGTYSDSGGYGIHTAAGSGASLQAFGVHLESNTSGGANLQGGGGGHQFNGGVCIANNGTCIRVDTETSNFNQTSARISGVYTETDSFIVTANGKNTVIDLHNSVATVTDSGNNTRVYRPTMGLQLHTFIFTTLPTAPNGSISYCSNCTVAAVCASGGTGAIAKRVNGAWVCN